MELTGILTFIGLFILIVSILVGIAYYGITESKYEEKPAVKQAEDKKKTVKKVKRDDSAKVKKAEKPKKRKNSGSSSEPSEAQEEEPLVIIPDPFTNKLSSRFAGAQAKKVEPAAVEKKEPVPKPVKLAFEKVIEKVKPQATVKPSQVAPLEEKKVPKPLENTAVQTQIPKIIEITDLTPRVKELEKSLSEKNVHIVDLTKKIGDFEKKVESLVKMNTHYQEELKALKQTNPFLQTELTRLTTLKAALERENIQIKHEIELLRTKPGQVDEQLVQQLHKELNDRTQIMAQLQSKNQTQEDQLSGLKENNVFLHKQLQTQEALTKQYEIKLEKSEKSLKSENDSLRQFGSQKEAECLQLRAQLDQASTGQSEQFNNLQKEWQHLNLNLQTMKSENEVLRSEKFRKDEEMVQLKSDLEILKTKASSIESEKNELKTRVDQLMKSSDQTETVKKLESELNELCAKLENSQNEINVKSGRVGELEQETRIVREQFESQLSQKDNELNKLKADLESSLTSTGQDGRVNELEAELRNKQTHFNEQVQHLNKVLSEKEEALNGIQSKLSGQVNELEGEVRTKQTQLDESFNHVQHLNKVIGEKDENLNNIQKQLHESHESVKHLNHVIGEKDGQLNDVNGSKKGLEQQIGNLKSENETLKQQIQGLESSRASDFDELNSKIKQLSQENEALRNKKSDESNGVNGHNNNTNKDDLLSQLDQLKTENENLKNLLEEEIKACRANQTERAKIRDLIKIGQDALEHEKNELLERLDTKMNGSNGH